MPIETHAVALQPAQVWHPKLFVASGARSVLSVTPEEIGYECREGYRHYCSPRLFDDWIARSRAVCVEPDGGEMQAERVE